MEKQTGWYYSSTDAGMTAHVYTGPLARGELHIPICQTGPRTSGRDLRHESLASTRCAVCATSMSALAQGVDEVPSDELGEVALAVPDLTESEPTPKATTRTRRSTPSEEV